MNDHDDSLYGNWDEEPAENEVVIRVIGAFDRMPIPPRPSVAEMTKLFAARNDDENSRRRSLTPPWRRNLGRRRMIMAGLGAVTVLTLGALYLVRPLSAMERMARKLRVVRSYRYELMTKTTSVDGDTTTTWLGTGPTYWRSPDAFREEMKIMKIEIANATGKRSEEVVEDFEQVFPASKRGIFIDRKRKQFFWQAFEPTGSHSYPLEMLKLIREESIEATKELGSKRVQGKEAQGYVVPLSTGFPPRLHQVEVWVDPVTDLPVEFGYEVSDGMEPRTTTVFRVSDFRWDLDLDAKLFDAQAPAGYHERQPPANP